MTQGKLTVIAMLVMLWAMAGCSQRTSIAAIYENPRAHDGHTITLSGIVKERVALLGAGGFVVDDGTGQIVVWTKRLIPAPGTNVTVRGRLRNLAAFGSQGVHVLMENDD